MGPHPPVPIVVDQTEAHKGVQSNNRPFGAGTLPGDTQNPGFCYDVDVWKHLTVRNGREFVKHVVPAVIKPARTLWNEIIGFFFICLAVYCGSGVVRSYIKLGSASADETTAVLFRLCLSAFCTILMLYFGITSFLRARKISRS